MKEIFTIIQLDGTVTEEYGCKKWTEKYTISLVLIYGIAVFIAGLNGTLRIVLRTISKTEGSHLISHQLSSSVTKMWLVMFVNTALVLLLINYRYNGLFSLPEGSIILAGKYPDFTIEWYGAVGAAIATSVFFGTVTPIFNLGFWFVNSLKKCCDRGCRLDPRRTRKTIQSEYERVYEGPVF